MRLPGGPVDAIVIGGGVQGLTFAFEAGRRNRCVVLLEAGTFGGGSTAASLGIVHGGFRYWQTLDVGRLLRSRREQAWFARTFPALVRPVRCILPFGVGDREMPVLFAAAALADRAAGHVGPTAGLPRPRLVGRREVLAHAPWLDGRTLGGAGCWYDLEIVDRAALTDALLQLAGETGAICVDRTEVVEVLRAPGGDVTGVEVLEHASGVRHRILAPVVANCAGAALGQVARLAHPACPHEFRLLPAFNLQFALPTPLDAAYAVGSGKRLFLRPVPGGVLAGTFYEPGMARTAPPPVERWLDALDAAAPGLNLRTAHVSGVLAGVVPAGAGATPAERDVILDHGRFGGPAGMFSISGVKLTTARWLSARAAARIWPASREAHRALREATAA